MPPANAVIARSATEQPSNAATPAHFSKTFERRGRAEAAWALTAAVSFRARSATSSGVMAAATLWSGVYENHKLVIRISI